jgi:hypothetical protein
MENVPSATDVCVNTIASASDRWSFKIVNLDETKIVKVLPKVRTMNSGMSDKPTTELGKLPVRKLVTETNCC